METEMGAADEVDTNEVVDPASTLPGLPGRPRPRAAPQLCGAERVERAARDEVRRVGGIATNQIQGHKDVLIATGKVGGYKEKHCYLASGGVRLGNVHQLIVYACVTPGYTRGSSPSLVMNSF